MLFSELLEKKKHSNLFWTGCKELDAELAIIRHQSALPTGMLTPCSQYQYRPPLNQTGDIEQQEQQEQPGIPSKSCNEISGPSGSGKTTIWLSLIIDALKQGFKVLYISGNYSRFPIERAKAFDAFIPERYNDKIHEAFVNDFEQLLTLLSGLTKQCTSNNYGIVILNRYDFLIPNDWSHHMQSKGYDAVSKMMEQLASFTCAIATCGVRKYNSIHEDTSKLLAPTSHIKMRPDSITSYMLYKNSQNKSVLYSGFQFATNSRCGVTAPSPPIGETDPVYLHGRRTTPKRCMVTPNSKRIKRRSSFSTPMKRGENYHAVMSSPRGTLSDTFTPKQLLLASDVQKNPVGSSFGNHTEVQNSQLEYSEYAL